MTPMEGFIQKHRVKMQFFFCFFNGGMTIVSSHTYILIIQLLAYIFSGPFSSFRCPATASTPWDAAQHAMAGRL